MTTTMPKAAFDRVVQRFDDWLATLPPEQAASLREVRGSLSAAVSTDFSNMALSVTVIGPNGPQQVMRLDPATVGLRLVGGEVHYVEVPPSV